LQGYSAIGLINGPIISLCYKGKLYCRRKSLKILLDVHKREEKVVVLFRVASNNLEYYQKQQKKNIIMHIVGKKAPLPPQKNGRLSSPFSLAYIWFAVSVID
jgi:hypothetical protein